MKPFFLRILFFLFCFGSFSLSAQVSSFRNYTVTNGLASSEVYQVMQDSKGYMWFATDKGVSRFDGYQFHTYTTANGLADNTVFECIEDKKNRIWFRSFSGRISYFFHDSVYQLPINETLVKMFKGLRVTAMTIDSAERISIATYGLPAIFQIDLKHQNTISTIPLPQEKRIIYLGINSTGNPIMGDNHKAKGAGTELEFFHSEILRFNLEQPQTAPVSIPIEPIVPPHDNTYHTMLRNKAVWVKNDGMAICLDTKLVWIDGTHTNKVFRFDEVIANLCPDLEGGVWICFLSRAPLYFRHGMLKEFPQLAPLKNKQITSVASDREGGLWFTCLNDGAFYLRSLSVRSWTTENELPSNKVHFMAIRPSDTSLWISYSDTHLVTRIKHDSIANFPILNIDPNTLLTGIFFHTDHSIWITSNRHAGIYRDNGVLSQQSLIPDGSKFLSENKDGSLWGIEGDSQLDLMLQENHNISRKKRIHVPSKVFAMCRDGDASCWLGTMNGLWQYEKDSLHYWGDKYPILKKRISDLQYSVSHDLWIATRDTGLIVLTDHKILRLTQKDGLPSNFCQRLYIDNKGDIWVGSTRGLSHIIVHHDGADLRIDTIQNINTFNFNEINCITGIGNQVYIGTGSGFTCFESDGSISNKTPPFVYVNSVKVNNRLITDISQLPEFSHDENYIVISYIGLSYRDAGNIQYRYRMEGIDTGWVYTKFTSAQYPKLPPGSYSFIVSAMNNDGVWNTHPVSVHFSIAPPWWATWWARGMALLAVTGFIYWRISTIKKREMRKTEVNRQLTDMQLKELKAQFDPHFLFNSLNILSHLSEESPASAPEYIDELSKFYRYSLKYSNIQFIELETEIEQAERYLHLLKLRFGKGLQVKWEIAESPDQRYILCGSLQLLIENITKHNQVSDEFPLLIEIQTSDNNHLTVINPLQPKNSKALSTGHGLKSITQRYELLTGKKINIIPTASFFKVELPLLHPEEYENINH